MIMTEFLLLNKHPYTLGSHQISVKREIVDRTCRIVRFLAHLRLCRSSWSFGFVKLQNVTNYGLRVKMLLLVSSAHFIFSQAIFSNA